MLTMFTTPAKSRLLRSSLPLLGGILACASVSLAQQPDAALAEPKILHVMVNKSLVVDSETRLKRVSVTDPATAEALVVSPNQVLIQAHKAGEISLILWDEAEHARSYDLHVDADLSGLTRDMADVFKNEPIRVTSSRGTIVLSGHVSSEAISRQADDLASSYSKNVINTLTFGTQGSGQEVLLEVKFAEVDRTALNQIGINLLSTGAGNTIGNITTGQFGSSGSQTVGGTIHGPAAPTTTTDTISNLLNVFLFNPDIHLGAVIQALQQRNLLQILAEPNLIAVSGKEASFLAGGEFPVPIVQPSSGTNAVTIQYKEFGVKLKFTPQLQANGNIHLHVIPEVSTLDFADGITLSGFTVPALSTRRADTEFDLLDGQSFVIAGLIDNRVTKINSSVPGLSTIPILGNLFKSFSFQRNNTELMVIVTARRVSPSSIAPNGPAMPVAPIDVPKFDEHAKEGSTAPGMNPAPAVPTPSAEAPKH